MIPKFNHETHPKGSALIQNLIKHTQNLGISPDLNYKTKFNKIQGKEHWRGDGWGCVPGKD
jgi:hypothetical protein